MANAKISDTGVFVNTITDITQIDGFAAYATASATGNAAMSGNAIVTSLEAKLDLANFQTGVLPVPRGGTGVGTLADGHILLGSGANAISTLDLTTKGSIVVGDGTTDPIALGVGTNGQVLTADSAEASGVKWATPSGGSVTTTYDQVAIIINFAVGGSPEFFDWGGVITPTGTQNSILPINEDCKITRIQMKYIDTTAFSCDAAFVYEVDVSKLDSPTAASNSSRTIYTGGTNVITIDNATDDGTFFLKDSGALDIDLTAGDVLAITGTTTAGTATGGSNEEVVCSITFERTYSVT